VDISCYAKFAEAVVTFVSDNSMLNRLIAGVAASKEIIVGLCLLALGKRLLSRAAEITFSYYVFTCKWIVTVPDIHIKSTNKHLNIRLTIVIIAVF